MLVVISQTLCFFDWFIQLLVIIKPTYKILSLTHRKCQSKPNIWIRPSFLLKNKYGRSQLCRDQIFSHTICLYNRKFDWFLIVDPIWLVWHTYISHWSTDPLNHWTTDPLYHWTTEPLIHPPITYPMRHLRGIFLQKIKSLVASQLIYVLSPLHTNENAIKKVNKLFYSFLWNGKEIKLSEI